MCIDLRITALMKKHYKDFDIKMRAVNLEQKAGLLKSDLE